MKATRSALWSVVALSLLVGITACAGAQQQPTATTDYKPEVGQQGKDVVWVPSPDELVAKMLDMAKVTKDDIVYDLGSGDGRTVIAAAKRGARAYGFEYNPEMVALSRRNAEEAGVSKTATFVEADLFETDLSKATVITMFLLPSINLRLRPILLELKPGTRIVSNTFTMSEWDPDETTNVDNPGSSWSTAFMWIIPAKVAGAWRLGQGTLTLTQEFQKLHGSLNSTPLTNGKLRGEEITFMVAGSEYKGTVKGNTMSGTVVTSGKSSSWQATRTGN